MNFFTYLKDRAKEPSTFAGLALVASAVATAAQAGGSRQAFVSAGLQLVLGLLASFKADPAKFTTEFLGSSAPVALSSQVAAMATELMTIMEAVAPVVAKAAPVAVVPVPVPVRDTIGK